MRTISFPPTVLFVFFWWYCAGQPVLNTAVCNIAGKNILVGYSCAEITTTQLENAYAVNFETTDIVQPGLIQLDIASTDHFDQKYIFIASLHAVTNQLSIATDFLNFKHYDFIDSSGQKVKSDRFNYGLIDLSWMVKGV